MKQTIGIGIIGTGFARKVQIPAFRQCEGAEIVSVASGTLENAEATAQDFGIHHFTADWRETIARDDIDLICITTPPKLHHEMTLAALEHRKHVLCEKPMAMNAAEARKMTDAANESGLLTLVDFELRFHAGRQRARAMIRDGEIGRIRHAKYHFQAPHRGDPSIEWNWWSDERQGGGALGAIVSHVIDSFHWLLGTTTSTVFGQLQTHIKNRADASGAMREVTADDESLLILRFSDGDRTSDATGIVSVSMTEFPQYKNRIEFYGTEGSIAVDQRGELLVAREGDADWTGIEVDLGQNIPGVADTGFARGFMAFAPRIVEAIRRGETAIEHAATFDDGLGVQLVLDAARESAKTGRSVTLVEDERAATPNSKIVKKPAAR